LIYNVTKDSYYGEIQTAINGASGGDEIEVAPGTYYEAIDFLGKPIHLYSTGATIDGRGHYHVVQCVNGEGSDTVLEGFTITGGNASGSSFPDNDGGGMFNNGASPTVINCTFSGNSANSNGGGMYNWQSDPTVTHCTFNGNTAGAGYGGGMYSAGSNLTVTNCTFSGNTAVYGGGMYSRTGSNPTVTNCTFRYNTADYGGDGGGMYNDSSNPIITNCILWDDKGGEIVGPATVTYSNVQGGWPGMGNINKDPYFEDSAGRLSIESPCIDVGYNDAVPSYITTDLDGNPRIWDGNFDQIDVVDMGAYEYWHPYDNDSDGIVDSIDPWPDSYSDWWPMYHPDGYLARGYIVDRGDQIIFVDPGYLYGLQGVRSFCCGKVVG
jgi:parallel beta-helix repeat protein